jgi:glycosyltransferase involved in cell wall biosynthesis
MKVAITGTRGIPNRYGGFEQFAEGLSVRMVKKGHEVMVYNPGDHSFKEDIFDGVQLVKIIAPFKRNPPLSSLLYDFLCLWDALKQKPDVIFNCGHTPSVFLKILKNPDKIPFLFHMDGMEWKRKKWGWFARAYLKFSERLAVKWADYQVVDNLEIQKYYQKKYGINPANIAYGADIPTEGELNKELLPSKYQNLIKGKEYFLVISRLEPENNTDMILKAFLKSGSKDLLIVIGNTHTKFGKKLVKDFGYSANIRFLGPVFDKQILNIFRRHSKAYVHGYSAGGTNPSLLEAMAVSCTIFTHDNPFNRSVLGENAYYFSTISLLKEYFSGLGKLEEKKGEKILGNLKKIREQYSWDRVCDQYAGVFEEVLRKGY